MVKHLSVVQQINNLQNNKKCVRPQKPKRKGCQVQGRECVRQPPIEKGILHQILD